MVHIQIAGPPDALSDRAEQRVRRVVDEYEFDCLIERVDEFTAIVDLQVFAVPGLIIDGVLKSVGRVPEIAELVDWLGPDDSSTMGQIDSGPS